MVRVENGYGYGYGYGPPGGEEWVFRIARLEVEG